MKTIIFEIASFDEAMAQIVEMAQAEKADTAARYTFPSVSDMARVLTPTRWGIVEAMTGAGPIGVRELARRTKRDVKGVHTDANALVAAGVIDRAADGKYVFPYDEVSVSFRLRAAA